MIQILIILGALGAVFFGGIKSASIYYTGKMAREKVIVQEDQAKKTKAATDSSVELNDFGNEEQRKSDAKTDQLTEEVEQEDVKATPDTRSRTILDANWLRKLDAIR